MLLYLHNVITVYIISTNIVNIVHVSIVRFYDCCMRADPCLEVNVTKENREFMESSEVGYACFS